MSPAPGQRSKAAYKGSQDQRSKGTTGHWPPPAQAPLWSSFKGHGDPSLRACGWGTLPVARGETSPTWCRPAGSEVARGADRVTHVASPRQAPTWGRVPRPHPCRATAPRVPATSGTQLRSRPLDTRATPAAPGPAAAAATAAAAAIATGPTPNPARQSRWSPAPRPPITAHIRPRRCSSGRLRERAGPSSSKPLRSRGREEEAEDKEDKDSSSQHATRRHCYGGRAAFVKV